MPKLGTKLLPQTLSLGCIQTVLRDVMKRLLATAAVLATIGAIGVKTYTDSIIEELMQTSAVEKIQASTPFWSVFSNYTEVPAVVFTKKGSKATLTATVSGYCLFECYVQLKPDAALVGLALQEAFVNN
jgi:hypothetical protein